MKSSEYLAPLRANDEFKRRAIALLDSKITPHALLITGEDGCGRNFAAGLVAAAFLRDPSALVARNMHPDCIVVVGEGASGRIPVRAVRAASGELMRSAVMTDGRRCAIIRNAFNLNANSANALLKMLEEPPEDVLFILTSRFADELLPTVRSRVAVLSVAPLNDADCFELLKCRLPDVLPQELKLAVSRCKGRVGIALAWLSAPELSRLSERAEIILQAAMREDKLALMSELDGVKTRDELVAVFDYLLLACDGALERDPERAGEILTLHDAVLEARRDIPKNINQKLLCARLASRI
ncbi:MAG: hypothetical protein RR998_01580 [Oscillospiraceae bacterium]